MFRKRKENEEWNSDDQDVIQRLVNRNSCGYSSI